MSAPRRVALLAHGRSRSGLVRAVAALALGVSALAGALPEPTARGVAAALAQATASPVAEADVVWEPSSGALVDAVWGRGVAFLAAAPPGDDGVARRDAFRARMTVSPGGRPLRVAAVERQTDTPRADEHHLMARGSTLAWLTRGVGGEHGATLLVAPEGGSPLERAARALAGAGLPPREVVLGIFDAPRPSARAELRDEGLALALGAGDEPAPALIDPRAKTWTAEPAAAHGADVVAGPVVHRPAAWTRWRQPPPIPPLDEPPDGLALGSDGVFPPAGPEWLPLVAAQVVVAGDMPAPAPVVRAEVAVEGAQVLLHAFDTRQLGIRVVAAPAGPRATSGLPGSGVLAPRDAARAVAVARLVPLADGGALQHGREIAPLPAAAPAIAEGVAGAPLIGPFGEPSGASAGGGAIETPDAPGAERAAAWCAVPGAVVVATARTGGRAAIGAALDPLGCKAPVWVDDSGAGATPRLLAEGPVVRSEPFAAFVRRELFPEGRPETWVASAGRQPVPAFRPAILETERDTLGARVRVVAFTGPLAWVLRAGTGERSHRAKGTFPETLSEAARARSIAAIGLGIGQRRSPSGLTIDGSTGHRYAARGGVLLAGPTGLQLVRSADIRADPPGDATELPLTVLGGELTPAARKRGLLHDRADLCVLPDGTVLVASARFDSHEAAAETLLRMGCADVAALDRGMDLAAELLRPTATQALPERRDTTTLIALEVGP